MSDATRVSFVAPCCFSAGSVWEPRVSGNGSQNFHLDRWPVWEHNFSFSTAVKFPLVVVEMASSEVSHQLK
jgi:hypothetical protein